MTQLRLLIKRNTKLFFKDKGMFFTALITPMILLMLYATFLGNIYSDSITSMLDSIGAVSDERVLGGFVGGQLTSSILAVSCVTVAICANMLMVTDKVSGARRDLVISPVSPTILSLSYYFSTLIVTFIICLSALAVCFIYLAFVGWYLTLGDVVLLLLDVFIIVMFGTALSSVISFFLSTQGQISAVGTIISSGYGFICGAYMPISQFSDWLRNLVGVLPGTYGTSLLRRHALRGAIAEWENADIPDEIIASIRDSVDYSIYVFDKEMPTWAAYTIICGAVVLLIGVYVLMNIVKSQKNK